MKLVALPLVLATLPLLSEAPGAQQSLAVYDAASVELTGFVPPFRRMLDFDQDGDPDAVGAQLISDNRSYRIYSYRNDGQGGFEQAGGFSTTTGTTQGGELLLEVGLLNADPWPDLCILFRAERHDWLGDGTGSFVRQPTVALGQLSSAMALADLDGDGVDDLVWLSGSELHVSISGGGAASIAVSGNKHGLRVLPGDGPGGSEVFLVHVNNEVRVFFGAPSGLSAGPRFTLDLTQSMMDVGDVDGDGDQDAVVFGASGYRVLRRLTVSTWDLEALEVGGPAEFLRDVDGDGDPDGVCCGGGGGGGGSYPENLTPTDFLVSINEGTGRFAPAFAIHGLGSPQLAGALDVDGDGDVDLVAGRCVYFADGPIAAPAAGEAPPLRGLREVSDCDGDGDPDVGFSLSGVYSNDGTGSFVHQSVPVLAAPQGMSFRGPGYPGDFDGDGDTDLLVELRGPRLRAFGQAAPIAMALLVNDGSGALLQSRMASVPGVRFGLDSLEAEASLEVDLDGDGDLDLLTRSMNGTNRTRSWINGGQGTFVPGPAFAEHRVAWAGDVDLDGDVDLLTSMHGLQQNELHLMTGSQAGPGAVPDFTETTFSCCWTFDPMSGGLPSGDYIDDGYPDFAFLRPFNAQTPFSEPLALTNSYGFGGGLGANVGIDSGRDMTVDGRIAIGDLDLDGIEDFLIGEWAGEQTTICSLAYKRVSGPQMVHVFDFSAQLVPKGFLIDLDGDGDLDLLGERIALNRTLP